MDPRIGLDHIVENRDYISKLGSALDTQKATVKKQVFELLSALCAYNSEGYARAIETLEFYKVRKSYIYGLYKEVPIIIDSSYSSSRISKRNVIVSKSSSMSWNSPVLPHHRL